MGPCCCSFRGSSRGYLPRMLHQTTMKYERGLGKNCAKSHAKSRELRELVRLLRERRRSPVCCASHGIRKYTPVVPRTLYALVRDPLYKRSSPLSSLSLFPSRFLTSRSQAPEFLCNIARDAASLTDEIPRTTDTSLTNLNGSSLFIIKWYNDLLPNRLTWHRVVAYYLSYTHSIYLLRGLRVFVELNLGKDQINVYK